MPWYDPRTWDESDIGVVAGGALGGLPGAGLGYMIGGAAESSREAQEKLRALQGQIPQAPGTSADVRGYMARIQELSGRAPGEGYMQSPLYRGLLSDVEQQGRQMGWANSAQQGRSGIMSGAGYGPGQQQATERMEAVGRLQQQAGRQAWEAQVQADAQKVDGLLRAAGFAQGIQDSRFDQEMRAFLAKQGLTQAQIDAEMDKWRMYFGLAGGVLNLGATAASSYAGAAAAGG